MIGLPKPCTSLTYGCMLRCPPASCGQSLEPVDEIEVREAFRAIGVSPGATPGEIRTAYRKLARQYHPDLNPGDLAGEEKFKAISAAYQYLRSAGHTEARRARQRPTQPSPDPSPWARPTRSSRRPPKPRWMVIIELVVVLTFTLGVFGTVAYLTYLHMIGWLSNGETVVLFSLLSCAYLLHVVVDFVGRSLNADR